MVEFKSYTIYPIGLAIALFIGAIVLLLIGVNPILAYFAILEGSVGSFYSISEVLIRTIPLLLTALAFSISYQAGFWNIGGEGQLYIGALAAVLLAQVLGGLPSPISILLIIIGSFLAGMAWVLIPLLLKIKVGTNEIFVTVLFNFISILFINYLCTGPIRDPSSVNPQTPIIPLATWLPKLMPPTRLHLGVIFPFLLAFLIYILLFKTPVGYKVRAVGHSLKSARYAGVKISSIFALTALLSGGMAGLAGMEEVLGTHHLLITGISPGFAFTGILVAVIGRFDPIKIIPASIFFSILLVGGETMQRGAQVPYGMIYILIALITFLTLAVEKLLKKEV